MRASRALREGRLEAALAAANEAVRQEPESPVGYHLRGSIRLLLNQHKEAIEDFRRAMARMEPGEDRDMMRKMIEELEGQEPEK